MKKQLNLARMFLVYTMVSTAHAEPFVQTINIKTTTDQIRVIAITLLSEARGEGDEGLKRVAKVIQNRAKRSGKNPAIECLKPLQFSFWNNAPSREQCLKLLSNPQADYAIYLASDILAGKEIMPLFAATHFHSGRPPYWTASKRMKFVEKYKGHCFYQEM